MKEKTTNCYLVEEYREIGINWRYWGEVRFKQLTVFLMAQAIIGGTALSEFIPLQDGKLKTYPFKLHLLLAIVGVSLTFLFYILEERATFYRRAYLHRAIKLEEKLRFWQYRVTNNIYWQNLRSEYIFRFFFFGVAMLWILHLSSEIPNKTKYLLLLVTILIISILWEYGSRLQNKASALYERRSFIRKPRPSPKGFIWLFEYIKALSKKK